MTTFFVKTLNSGFSANFRQISGKKDQISGVFSPKMALCRTGNITDLFYLQKKMMLQVAVSGCSIIDGPQ